MTEAELREEIVASASRCSTAATASARATSRSGSDGVLVTPTNTSLGRLDPRRIAKLSADGGPSPATSRRRRGSSTSRCTAAAGDAAVVHLHSTYSVAVSTLAALDSDVLPPVTAYFVMRVGRLPLVPYFVPGDLALAAAVGRVETCRMQSC